MSNTEFQLRSVGDPRLAVHVTSALPVWLWSVDGTRILWANPVGARLFGAAHGISLAEKILGPADVHRRQVAQLAGKLPPTGAVRLERLRGFGAPPGMLVTCGCARLAFADGSHGILVAATETRGRTMPLIERLQNLVDGIDTPVAAFAHNGMFVGANDTARSLLGFCNLSGVGFEQARSDALKHGRGETAIGIGHVVLQRVGSGADVGLIALIAPALPQAAPIKPVQPLVAPVTDYEQTAIASETRTEHDLAITRKVDMPGAATSAAKTAVETVTSDHEIHRDQLSSFVEVPTHEPSSQIRRHPLRFMWQMDTDGRFSLCSDEFTRLIGTHIAVGFGRLWSEITKTFGLDPNNRILQAVATRNTWSGITLNWPVDGGDPLPVELSGLPIYDRMRNFAGYRGFGVCRDLDGLARLAGLRRHELLSGAPAPPTLSTNIPQVDVTKDSRHTGLPAANPTSPTASETPAPLTVETSLQADLKAHVKTSQNIIALRPVAEAKSPALTPVESSAFHELARQLSARLEGENSAAATIPVTPLILGTEDTGVEQPTAPELLSIGHTTAEELGAILDTAADGIVMFDAEGNLNSCNRSAEALFGYGGDELTQHNISELFAPESQRMVKNYLESVREAGLSSLLDHGREVLGRANRGGFIPLSMTMGRTRADGPNFFAMFRDLSQAKKSENELREARRLADRAANAKADMLSRISHEIRMPLNAIIGFAEVMIDERFGALGNERYIEYMKDIRASGERITDNINDLLDLSRIETGKLDLAFTSQSLNDIVESCVAVMQPQANRERIIIRTSLAHALPLVVADAHALHQITMKLIGNSIHLARAGGQVIVSTALSDFGEVILRVRDTGHGLNDNDVATTLDPFRTQAPSDQASDNSGVSLSLTKALVEANRAQFHIKSDPRSGTLIEVVFSHEPARV